MVKTCVAQFCNNTTLTKHSIFDFPKDPSLSMKWSKFVNTKRANFVASKGKWPSHLCHEHFSPECFDGQLQYDLGYKKRRTLKKGSIPTIHAVRPASDVNKDVTRKRQAGEQERSKVPEKRSRAVGKLMVARVSKQHKQTIPVSCTMFIILR
jgi:hypothetical protein